LIHPLRPRGNASLSGTCLPVRRHDVQQCNAVLQRGGTVTPAAVANDVDLWSEFVKLEATVTCHVLLAREVPVVAVAPAEHALSEAVLGAMGSGR
jgi:hypothetical protein